MAMKTNYLYPIRQVSKQTGLPAYLIRVWESRYSAVSPQRSNGNRRVFCESDITKLKLLSKAVENGHSISQVAALSHEELMAVVGIDSFETRHAIGGNETDSMQAESYIQKSLKLVAELDINGLQDILDTAAVNLTRPTVILDFIVPLFSKTRQLVQSGKLRLISLNAATLILQSYMWDLLRNSVVSDSAPKIVVGTPTGQRSEIVALALALNAVESGYRSLYFGSNLPAKDLAAAVKSNGAQAVALYIDDSKVERSVESEIEKLQESLDDNINILICTNDNSAMSELIRFNGISLTTLRNFRQKLENLATANNSVDDRLMTRQFVTMEEFNNEMVT